MSKQVLRNTRQFNHVYKKGKSIVNRQVVMYYVSNELGYNQVGFSVSKKVGKAVIRNRVKRLMKESFRINSNVLMDGYDIVFVARVRLKDADFKEIEKAMIHAFKKSTIFRGVK